MGLFGTSGLVSTSPLISRKKIELFWREIQIPYMVHTVISLDGKVYAYDFDENFMPDIMMQFYPSRYVCEN